MSVPAVEAELHDLIRREGPVTFDRFQQACLYSPAGGFYSSREGGINDHFQTSSTVHPAFGALLARQLHEMWQVMGEPNPFHVIEVGSGDGSLARAITAAVEHAHPALGNALRYIAADYAPVWPASLSQPFGETAPSHLPVDRVKAAGLDPFRGITGCILSNELQDNFPVHRFQIRDGKLLEVYVTSQRGAFVEQLDEPSTPRLAQRLSDLGVVLPDGTRGEVSLALDDWIAEVDRVLDRGFVLTIDYGGRASELYSVENPEGTLICFREHIVGNDPYTDVGEQDITSYVDFSSLMLLGDSLGIATAGYTRQAEFLEALGFDELMAAVDDEDLQEARKQLKRIAMSSLVDPEQTGEFRVLAQAKGLQPIPVLKGFVNQLER